MLNYLEGNPRSRKHTLTWERWLPAATTNPLTVASVPKAGGRAHTIPAPGSSCVLALGDAGDVLWLQASASTRPPEPEARRSTRPEGKVATC